MRFLICFLVVMLTVTSFGLPAWAKSCYNAKEAEAEQGVRIHSELMVIGLNCQHMTPKGWTNFYSQYRTITNRNQSLFQGYEKTLLRHYNGNAKRIHTLRTGFANKISTNAAHMRPDVFCATFAPRIPQVAQMSKEQIRQWVSSASKTEPQTKAACR